MAEKRVLLFTTNDKEMARPSCERRSKLQYHKEIAPGVLVPVGPSIRIRQSDLVALVHLTQKEYRDTNTWDAMQDEDSFVKDLVFGKQSV